MTNTKSSQRKKRIWMLIQLILPTLIGYINPSLEIPISLCFLIWNWLKEEENEQDKQ